MARGIVSTSTEASAPQTLDDVTGALEAAGYTVKKENAEPLARREDGGIVQPDGKIVVTGNGLAGDVSVYELASPKDVAVMQGLAGGGVSLVSGNFYIQASEQGAAETVAQAAGA